MKNKKYLIDNKDLMREWDFSLNKDVDISKITFSSAKEYWWTCVKGHSWKASVANRNRGTNCPICSGRKVQVGYNDIFTKCPNLKKEWDFEKNKLDPYKLTVGSNKMVYWLCKNGHSFVMRISHRTNNHGCPYCSGLKMLKGYNDLETWCKVNNISTLERWNYDKNVDPPSDYSKGSKKEVWWKCKICGNEWKNQISKEINKLYCPKCNKRNKTSFPEQAIFYYLKQLFSDSINGYRNNKIKISELDIYIPTLKIGIEYDGKKWHSSKESHKKELLKYEACKKNKIFLIRIREKLDEKGSYSDKSFISHYNEDIKVFNQDLKDLVDYICQINNIHSSLTIDVISDRNLIYEQYLSITREKSLMQLFPTIANEWEFKKNYPITPEMVPAFSNDNFWFRCSNNHSYNMIISKRTTRGDSCPYCSSHKVLIGYNDLKTTNPKLINEWNYNRNKLKPTELTRGYDKKVWWICSKCDNEFECSPNSRTSQNVGCPICKGGVPKEVNQYDLNGIYLKSFKSLSEAARNVNVSIGAILRACTYNTPSKDYLWRYSDRIYLNVEKYSKEIFNNKKVNQFSLNGEYINTYDSMTIAKEITGASKISEVCNGKRKSSGGFIWKYEKDDD